MKSQCLIDLILASFPLAVKNWVINIFAAKGWKVVWRRTDLNQNNWQFFVKNNFPQKQYSEFLQLFVWYLICVKLGESPL